MSKVMPLTRLTKPPLAGERLTEPREHHEETPGPEIIVAALLQGVTLEQLDGMVQTFNRYAAVYESLSSPDYRSAPPI
jgi:hypothetical protein